MGKHIIYVRVMAVERAAVDVRQCAQLLDSDLRDLLFLQQSDETLLELFLCVPDAAVFVAFFVHRKFSFCIAHIL